MQATLSSSNQVEDQRSDELQVSFRKTLTFLRMAEKLEPGFYDFREENLSFANDGATVSLVNQQKLRYKQLSNQKGFFELQHPSVVSGDEFTDEDAFNWDCVTTAVRVLTGASPFEAEKLFEVFQRICKRLISPKATNVLKLSPPGIAYIFTAALEAHFEERTDEALLCGVGKVSFDRCPPSPSELITKLQNYQDIKTNIYVEKPLEEQLKEKTELLDAAYKEIELLKRRLAMYEGPE